MKGREGKGPPSADLLVCFPSRAHLTLMPKPICSPARLNSEPNKRHQHQHQHHQKHRPRLHQQLRKSSNRGGGAGHASPLMWAKNKATSSEIEEPTSPKVTCAGQIKVRPKPNTCKNWQSVMEEIERLHNNKKHKKRPAWFEAIGFKKDIMQFLTCLRSIRFDFHCFSSFPTADITSDDDEEEDEDDDDYAENRAKKQINDEDNETSRTVFSKWFMVLQENQSKQLTEKESKETINKSTDDDVPCAPPPNALLLMRCRSAPAKSWLEEKLEENQENNDQEEEEEELEEKLTEEEENAKRKENLVVMQYGADFYKFSSDIAKETWVVGGIKDSLSRSRSWKR
ncbi:hypothetical protein Adt_47608 [Abeliophyllum distichum]|uniref:Uncharacterized protein n=1 Tax=Abeliophyllum distichum TaxID=126358 RepID=A0ABD1NTF4_9LAMI